MLEALPRKLQHLMDEMLHSTTISADLRSQNITQIAQNYQRYPKHKLNQKFVSCTTELDQLRKQKKIDPGNNKLVEKIKQYEIEQKIWEEAIQLRKELYQHPKYPLEGNVAEAGAFSVTKRRKKAPQSLLVERKSRGAVIRHFGDMELTVTDAKLLLVMHKLWEEKGRGKEIEVSFYEIAKKLNRPKSGKTYEDIRNSLLTLFRTEIKFENFVLNGEKVKTQFIHIMQGVAEIEAGEKARVRFSDYIYDSLQSGYFIYISMALLEDLSSSAAQGLYPFIAAQSLKGIQEWYVNELCMTVNITAPRPSERLSTLINAFQEMSSLGIIYDFKHFLDESGAEKIRIDPSPILANSRPPQLHDPVQLSFQFNVD
ncbi:replication initiator protein A [Paenibacillus sp. GYB004]|uniref:replication initiator protein A n=1 Tax=Paenibacillus sp. GYB004 TaxID=2994393 RepID=UPI002F96658B